ncbi:MAG: hypothetical protein E7460_06360 [Ruminococcaceae bacterium]|nr:hypothetical protein [Oscillospiraceae bacterium]
MKVKRLLSAVLLFAVIASIATVSFAVETRAAEERAVSQTVGLYEAHISYPSTGSGQVAGGPIRATGGYSPWFQSSVSTVNTNYCLSTSGYIGDLGNCKGTYMVTTGNTARNYFTYYTGHGGAGIYYYIVAGGANYSYDPYNVRGTWTPD